MKPALLVLACLLLFQRAGADQIELVVGKEVSAAAYTQLRRLNLLGSGSDILNRRPGASAFVDRTEYVAGNSKFVVAIEVTCDPMHQEGKSLLTRVYFSNQGERVGKDGEWKWIDAKKVVIDTENWKASIQDDEQDGADQPATAPESKAEGNQKPKPESEVRPQ